MAGQDALIESLVERMMADEKQFSELYEEVLTEKTFDAIKSRISIVDKPIDEETFNSTMSAARYEASKARGEVTEGGDDAEVEEIEAEEMV